MTLYGPPVSHILTALLVLAGAYATVALDGLTGSELWSARYNGPGSLDDSATALALTEDGSTVFITGYSWSTDSGADYATIAYDASTGAVLWGSWVADGSPRYDPSQCCACAG